LAGDPDGVDGCSRGRVSRPASLDVPGAALSTGGMLLLVYALVQGPTGVPGGRCR
jgi:hypothetical protein